jgi:hypothetical protein
VPASAWDTWTDGYWWAYQYGYWYVAFPPLFGHQYSHCWVDFRDIHDEYMAGKGITYFENSRRATLAQQAYCIANPGGFIGYGADLWGLTASDGPWGYNARGAPPAQNDDGTITPTAPISSIAFAPEIVIPTLHYMYDNFGPFLFDVYGFKDAFNLSVGWWATDYIGIDQGPIVLMIENYQTGEVWRRFMGNPDIINGLVRAGFISATGVDEPEGDAFAGAGGGPMLLSSAPNPFRGSTTVFYRLPAPGHVSLRLYDILGRRVQTLVDRAQDPGEHRVVLDARGLSNGVYFYRLETRDQTLQKRCVLLK